MNTSRPELMKEVRSYMNGRFDFSGRPSRGHDERGRAVMAGPASRLPKSVKSWEELAKMTPRAGRGAEPVPSSPGAPHQTTAHMVFPDNWLANPMRAQASTWTTTFLMPICRISAALFITTHLELGDVTQGKEIAPSATTSRDLRRVLTPADGGPEGTAAAFTQHLVQPHHAPHHRRAQRRVACMSCRERAHQRGVRTGARQPPQPGPPAHGHPSMRGNYNLMQFLLQAQHPQHGPLRRGGGEYFDGDQSVAAGHRSSGPPEAGGQPYGRLQLIIDFPPRPSSIPWAGWIKGKATESGTAW